MPTAASRASSKAASSSAAPAPQAAPLPAPAPHALAAVDVHPRCARLAAHLALGREAQMRWQKVLYVSGWKSSVLRSFWVYLSSMLGRPLRKRQSNKSYHVSRPPQSVAYPSKPDKGIASALCEKTRDLALGAPPRHAPPSSRWPFPVLAKQPGCVPRPTPTSLAGGF